MIFPEAFNGKGPKKELHDIFTRGYVVLIKSPVSLHLVDIDKKILVVKGHKEFEKDGFNSGKHV
jgi:hypothetical protein